MLQDFGGFGKVPNKNAQCTLLITILCINTSARVEFNLNSVKKQANINLSYNMRYMYITAHYPSYPEATVTSSDLLL